MSQQSSAPIPGANDVSQLSTTGNAANPNSQNYFSNNNNNTTPIPPGEQFTTPGGNPGGYTLTDVYFMTGNGSGNGLGALTPWTLYVYSVSGSTAILLHSYSGFTGSTFVNNDWIHFSGLSVALAANTTYAYAVYSGSSPYTGLENSTASLAGGNAALINTGSGAITTVTGFNGVFDVALTPIAAPGPPTGIKATPGNNQVALSWTAPGGTVTGYNVYRSTTSGSGYAVLPAGANVSGSPFTDSTAVNGTTYYYVITSLNGALQSAFSSQVSATPPRTNTVATWNGIQTSDNNWTLSFTEGNWIGSGSGNYYLNGDSVNFNDDSSSGAQTVNLNVTIKPGGLAFANTNVSYTISGTGAISGTTGLTNVGPGTLTLAESGGDNFSGGITASGGRLILDDANGAITGGGLINPGAVVQVGNNDGQGALPSGTATDNGTLVFNHGANSIVSSVISGSGILIQSGGDLLQLSGNNSFAGMMIVSNSSTLQAGNDSAFGTTNGAVIVTSGSTLDENGYYADAVASEPIFAQGTGVGGNGALVNNAGYGDLLNVTLTGDTTIGGTARFDMSGTLSTGGHAYNLTITGSSYHEWNDLTVDPNLANVTIGGAAELGYKGTTTIGSPSGSLSVLAGATLTFWQNGQPVLAKHLILNDGATLHDGDASATVNGPVTLTNTSSTLYCNFDIGGPSVTLNGPLDGDGAIYMSTDTGTLIVNSNSPAFTGGALVYNGALIINGIFGSGNVTIEPGTILAGTGTVNGLADVSGALVPGNQGLAGTFKAAGGLTLENGATVTNGLSATIASSNDLIAVTGNLIVNNNTIVLNLVNGTLQNGIYPLITYTGTLSGSFAGVQTASPSVYTLTLTNIVSTNPKEIGVIVGGNPSQLVWNNGSGNGEWDILGSYNWTNLATHTSEQFASADSVTFDNSITTAANAGLASSTNIDIASGQIVIPAALTNNSTVDYTISGAGKISGTTRILKMGGGTLTINTTNDFTGGITINGGTVNVNGGGGLTSLGSGSPMVNSGGSLIGTAPDAFGYAPNAVPTNIIINGGTVSDSGSSSYRITLPNVTFMGGTLTSAAGNLGDANGNYSTWGNGTTCTIATLATNSTAIISAGAISFGKPTTFNVAAGNVTGGATPGVDLLVASQLVPYGTQPVTKTGLGTMALDAVSNTFIVPITISAGTLQLGAANDAAPLVSPLGAWPAVTNNATLSFASSQSVTVTNVIAGTGAVVVNSGTAILDATNTDSGGTTVNGGTLEGTGSVGGNVVVNSGGTISAGTNGLTGILSVSGNATLGGNALLKLNGTTNDVLSVGGALTCGGTLTLTNISATPLAAGQSFQLFSAGTYSGSFAGIVTEPPLAADLSWNTANLNVNGTISVVTTTPPTPVITHIGLSGTTLTIIATNGASNGQVVLLESTNLATPFAMWKPVLTNTFNANGNLNLSTNIINPAVPRQFFILSQ